MSSPIYMTLMITIGSTPGWLHLTVGFTQIIFTFLIGYLGARRHKPSWMSNAAAPIWISAVSICFVLIGYDWTKYQNNFAHKGKEFKRKKIKIGRLGIPGYSTYIWKKLERNWLPSVSCRCLSNVGNRFLKWLTLRKYNKMIPKLQNKSIPTTYVLPTCI